MHLWLYAVILLNSLYVLRTIFQIEPTRNTYLEKCLTLNCTFPSRRSGGSSSPSVMSFQSCGSTSDSQCNILSSPWHNSDNSCFPLQRVRGILIVTGAMRVTFWVPEMCRTGPTSPSSPFNLLLGNSCTLIQNQKMLCWTC